MELEKTPVFADTQIESEVVAPNTPLGSTALSTELNNLISEDRYDTNSTFSGNPEDPLGLYLNGIGGTPLLTAREEVELAKQIERGRELSGIENPTVLQSREIRRAKRAKELFITSNLRLVVSIAKRYPLPQGMDRLDLVQEGNLGLEHAVGLFDHERGFKFSTYATFWIRQSIGRALDQKSSTIRLPGEKAAELRAALRAVEGDRELLENNMAELEKLSMTLSYDKPVGEDGDSSVVELFVADNEFDPEKTFMNQVDSEIMDDLLSTLDHRTVYAIKERFGINESGEKKPFREIGLQLGVTGEAARRLVTRGISSLQDKAPKFFEELSDI